MIIFHKLSIIIVETGVLELNESYLKISEPGITYFMVIYCFDFREKKIVV